MNASVFQAPPILVRAANLTKSFNGRLALNDVSLELHHGEVLAVVGESGSGKSTLLNCLVGELAPDSGKVVFHCANDATVDIHRIEESIRRRLARTEWGHVLQNPDKGLRLSVSAGANIAERLMAMGMNHYGKLRQQAITWMERVELDSSRVDDSPVTFSGGMKQRLQIARNLVSDPRVIYMDEPTSGLDVSVQARLLDLLRQLTSGLGLSVVIVTHDLGVARLLSHRVVVMRHGEIVEQGLTDRVLDDPRHEYTQLLVSSVVA